MTTPRLHSVARQKLVTIALDIFYLHKTFGDCRFSSFGDMTAGIEIENGSCGPDHDLIGVVCHPQAGI